ncbi:hypothetical protein [Comamonas sp.]|uniref:hypothetical protein n=1 Tax=Comamonas sp. TaxID=34028 RepID=UPI0012D0E3ED|nr:hypothetical protein [Comamonas sp.]MPS92829.1 hypothetical protein [Comamonas sp.]
MAKLEILILNYLAVFFLTIAISIFISKPEKILKAFSFWTLIAQSILALLLYKVIQIYDQFQIIYIVDVIVFAIYLFSRIPKRTDKKSKFDHLADSLSKLHKLAEDDFTTYITTLFKAYGFQSVRQVKVETDDSENPLDQYLLARHEASLVEIRVLSQIKNLSEEHINTIASSFRESTSQATIRLLVTCGCTNENTEIHIRNSGVDLKVFDLNAITDLVYVLAPDHQPKVNFLTHTFIRSIDYMLEGLTSLRNKLEIDDSFINKTNDLKTSKNSINNILNTANDTCSTIELFEENLSEPLVETETIKVEKNRKRKKKRAETPNNENQGSLVFAETNEKGNNDVLNEGTPSSVSEKLGTNDPKQFNEEVTSPLISNQENSPVPINEPIIELIVDSDNKTSNIALNDVGLNISGDTLGVDSEEPATNEDNFAVGSEEIQDNEDILIEEAIDPLSNFDALTLNTVSEPVIDFDSDFPTSLEDFPEVIQTDSLLSNDLNSIDLPFPQDKVNNVQNDKLEEQILENLDLQTGSGQSIDIQIDLSDLGGAIPSPPNSNKMKKE